MRKKNILKKGLSVVLSASFVVTSIPCGIQAAVPEETKSPDCVSEYRNVYFVDCGDYDVTTVSEGDAFGEYNSVTDQIYGEDSKAGKHWGIVDAPVGGGVVLGGTVYQKSSNNGVPTLDRVINAPTTNWTWPQSDDWDGISDGDPKEKTTRFTKNQIENGMERRIQYKFELEPGTYEVETYMADPWGVSGSAYIYANKNKENEVQIANQGTEIAGKPLKAEVTVGEDKELTLEYGSNDDVNGRAVNVSYIMITRDGKNLYFVDCGDYDVTTVSEGDAFGEYNSVTDQIYGKDSKTGKYWGIVDAPAGGGVVLGETVYQESSNSGAPTLDRVINAPATNWTWPQSDEGDGISDGFPKEKTNRFTKNQIENGLERQIQYKFELEPGTYEVETYMADPWRVSGSAYIYANKNKENEVQIANQGTEIAGKPLKAEVTVGEDHELTLDYGSNDDVNGRAVNVSYIMIARIGTEADRMNLDWHDLSLPTEVYDTLELPTTGSHGTQITWASDNESIITKEGKVTRPQGQDVPVTLTATVTLGELEAVKDFQVTVKAEKEEKLYDAFDMSQVKVTESYYVNSLNKDLEYLLSLDTDRLLAGFRENAAYAAGMDEGQRLDFMKHKVRYEGWESMMVSGQDVGHYLSAMAFAYANAGTTQEEKNRIKDNLDYMVKSLAECQAKSENSAACEKGFLFSGTIEEPRQLERQFDSVEGKGGAQWVPWYNMHKVLAGLIDVYKWTGDKQSLDMAAELGMWIYNRVSKWTNKSSLWVEFGGMNDALYDLYTSLEEQGYPRETLKKVADAGFMFEHEEVYERVATDNWGQGNALKGLHANTQVPKFVGAAKRYLVLGESEEKYLEYAREFWDMVVQKHTFVTGGNSQWEHFQDDNTLNSIRHVENCETCNTYNMLKLSRLLYQATGEKKYLDYYENTLINAIMSSQNPETGMFMYFQPMCTGYQKVYCDPYTDFWCCTGTGMENFTKLNDSIYYKNSAEDTVVVAQYLSSELTWEEKNVKLTMDSGIQTAESDTAIIKAEKLDSAKDMAFNLKLRVPDWAAGAMVCKVNGQEVKTEAADGFVHIALDDEAVVEVQIPMEVKAYNLVDSQNTYAFKYGPVLLSAKLGTENQGISYVGNHVDVPNTCAVENDRIEISSADSVEEYMSNISGNLKRNGDALEFTLAGTNVDYVFVPHYSQHKESYGIYWTYSIDTEAREGETVRQDKLNARQNRVRIDAVQAGYGQYEEGLQDGDETSVGSAAEHIRYAKAGGFFQYEVKVDESSDNYLLCTLRREDDGLPFYITVGGVQLFGEEALDQTAAYAKRITLTEKEFESYYQILVKLPQDLIQENVRVSEIRKEGDGSGSKVVDVRFAGTKEKESARLYYWMYNQKPYGSENGLKMLKVNGDEKADFADKALEVIIPASENEISLEMEMEDGRGYISINDKIADESKPVKLSLNGYRGDYAIRVWAEDFENYKEYQLRVIKNYETNKTDDFSNGNYSDRYDIIGSRWNGNVRDGVLSYSTGDGDKMIMKDVSMADGVYQMDVKLISGGNTGFIFRASNFTETVDGLDGYYAGIENRRLVLGRMKQSWIELKGVEVPELELGTWHTLKVAAFGSRIQVYLDDVKTPYIDLTDSSYREGGVGIRGFNASAEIDNIKVETVPYYTSCFENGTAEWKTAGDWSVEAGAYKAASEGYALVESSAVKEVNYAADLTLEDENTKAALMIRAASDRDGLSGYGLAVDVKNKKLQWIKAENGKVTVLSEAECPVAVKTGTANRFAIEMKGNILKAYSGDSTKVVLEASDSEFAAGQIGLWNMSGRSSIDNIVLSGNLINGEIEEPEKPVDKAELEEAVRKAQEAREAAEAAQKLAEAARAEAEKQAKEAQAAEAAAKEALKKAEEMANASKAEKEAAEKAAQEAKQKAKEAKAQADAANEAAINAQEARKAAEAAASAAEAQRKALESELNAAKTELQNLKEEMLKAKEEAQKAQADAAEAEKRAAEAAKKAEEMVNASKEEKEAAEKAAQEAKQQAKEAKAQADAANEAARKAQEAKEAAEATIEAAEAERKALESELNAAKTELEKLKAEAQKAKEEAQKAQAEAAEALKQAKEALEKLQQQITPNDPVIQPPADSVKKGYTWSDGKLNYKVTGTKTVKVTGAVKKNTVTSVVIPAVVKIKGSSYKVTLIAKNAFKANKKLKRVVIGKNVTCIGVRAFYGCKQLKKVKIKGAALTKVKKNAFKKISKKAVITIQKKSKKRYYKNLLKKTAAKGVKIK